MESWDCLTDKLTRIMKDNIPESKAPLDPTKRRPYVNSTCLNSFKVKHRKWTRYRHSMTDANYEAYKSARNNVKTELRKAKYIFEKDLASKIKTDNKLFWSYVRSKMKTRSGLGELEMPNGCLASDNQEKANTYTKFLFC